jgi:HAD superfamily hydrolase (TIGR01490 family)
MKTSVAAFDFDGTVASGDAVVPFVMSVIGPIATARALAHVAPLLRFRDRDKMKERFVAAAFTGRSEDELLEKGRRFARRLHVNRVRPTMLERIEWHRERNHRLIFVSASFNLYLDPLAQILGFDDVLATSLEFVDGRATGRLLNGNIRGNAKARALQMLFDGTPVDLWAYGNSVGDIPMLARADHAFWVTRSGEIRAWSESTRKVIDIRQPDDAQRD